MAVYQADRDRWPRNLGCSYRSCLFRENRSFARVAVLQLLSARA
jgi:hypothetical protein